MHDRLSVGDSKSVIKNRKALLVSKMSPKCMHTHTQKDTHETEIIFDLMKLFKILWPTMQNSIYW